MSLSQNAQIKAHLDQGHAITGLDAFVMFGCLELPRRICDLTDNGYPIERQRIKTRSGKTVMQYWRKADAD